MALVAGSAVLAATLCAATGNTTPVAVAAMGGMTLALCTWITTNAVVNNIPPADFQAGALLITGTGRVVFSNAASHLGDALAASVGAIDPPGIAAWRAIAASLHEHIEDYGRPNGTGMVTPGFAGGSVTGQGGFTFTTTTFDTLLSTRLALIDPPNVALWLAIGNAILAYIQSAAKVGPGGPTGFAGPPGGGPLTGVSVLV